MVMTQQEMEGVIGVLTGYVDQQLAVRDAEIAALKATINTTLLDGGHGGRVDQVEASINEMLGWAEQVQAALGQITAEQTSIQSALVRLMAGGSTAEWRAFVVREAARLGVGPKELGLAARGRQVAQEQAAQATQEDDGVAAAMARQMAAELGLTEPASNGQE